MSDQQGQMSGDECKFKSKQEIDRKFGCPCGKKYLSYPALFTHVKQKHGGKPPGQLIKPKTEKARGRPRLPVASLDEENSVQNYDCSEELANVISNKKINYNAIFEYSSGKKSCQDMASNFLNSFQLKNEEKIILVCLMNYIKEFINIKYSPDYWSIHSPNEIIDISNDIVRDLEHYQHSYPLERDILIDLLYVLFRWMYKNRWTDHKLMKRKVSEVHSQLHSHTQEDERSQMTK